MAKRRREQPLSEPEYVDVELTDAAAGGAAIGRVDGQVVFASYGIPGERVTVEVERRHDDYLEGRVTQVHAASPHRVEPRCPLFGQCGGCQYQHVAYPHQLEIKTKIVADQLRRIGKFPDPPVRPMLGADDPWHYRNHMRFTAKPRGEVGFVSRPPRRRFLRVDHCYIARPEINAVLEQVQGRAQPKLHQVAVRYGVNTGELLIQPDLGKFGLEIPSGQPRYHEVLLGRRFAVSGPSFFQVNTPQAERLAALVRDRLELRESHVLVDAYAGVGTFAALLAGSVRRVVAIEESPSAVKDAALNLQGIDNVELRQGRVEDILPVLREKPDAVILDPSREGCHQRALEAVLRFRPWRVVYVSCDPATLARDLRVLVDGGYRLDEVQPVDMFPQTQHIECVATLTYAGP
ncbi:MAG TPA: 23S rRNA (uracil(1939)-C(5))-methyltransferase RlmD [Dehalococcoidia bacterium]